MSGERPAKVLEYDCFEGALCGGLGEHAPLDPCSNDADATLARLSADRCVFLLWPAATLLLLTPSPAECSASCRPLSTPSCRVALSSFASSTPSLSTCSSTLRTSTGLETTPPIRPSQRRGSTRIQRCSPTARRRSPPSTGSLGTSTTPSQATLAGGALLLLPRGSAYALSLLDFAEPHSLVPARSFSTEASFFATFSTPPFVRDLRSSDWSTRPPTPAS